MSIYSGKPGRLYEAFILCWLIQNMGEGAPEPFRHSYLLEDLGMDDDDIVELIWAIDEKYGFKRLDPTLEHVSPLNVDDLVNYCIMQRRYNAMEPA